MQKHRTHERFLPAMGHDWLLPLYDPFQRLVGTESLHRLLVERADVRAGHKALEIGCGTGNLLIVIKRSHPQAEVVGLDPDPKALARARRKATRKGLSIELDRGFAEDLPYPDGSFDRVFSSLMFHHLEPEQRVAALREVRRVLRPGGSLHLLDFGGERVPTDGLIARFAHRSPRLHDNFGDGIPTLMGEAGLENPAEVAHKVNRMLGRVAYFRATAPGRT
jgi:ubiquinone/menaquinone biosynthesis C-methylase UbiE